MPINADKPHLWKADTRASVDQFNQWFMKFAPKAYRDTRKQTIKSVEEPHPDKGPGNHHTRRH